MIRKYFTDNPQYRVFAAFAFIIICWGVAVPINKIGLNYLSPIWYTAMRLVVGTLTMMLLVLALDKFTWPDRRDIPLIVVIGTIQIALYVVFLNLGLAYMPAAQASILSYTTPLWVMPLGILFFQEKPRPSQWIGFLCGLVGLGLLLAPWQINWSNHDILFGAAMALLSSLAWAVSILCARYMHWHKSPVELLPWQLLLGTIPILMLAWYKEPLSAAQWNWSLILSLAYMGTIVAALSYWASLIVNKELPPLTVSLGGLLVPLLSLVTSAFFLHETITLTMLAAMGFILAGVVCVVM
jgi:drug/metabolite transporter (DMT)-like permease